MLCFLSGGGVADLETQSKARAVITEVQAASLLHSIISAGSPRIQLEEVEDAIARLPWRISESTDDRCLPWPTVIHQIGLGYDEMMGGISTGKKPSADTLDFLGQK